MDTKLQKNVQRYIELVYSEKSELNTIQDLEERKKLACEKAKLQYDDTAVQKILHIKDKEVNELIFEYCRTTCPNEFYLLIADQHFFWEQMQILMEPLKKITEDGKTEAVDEEEMLKRVNLKNTVSMKCQELLERITSRVERIFPGEKEKEMAQEKIRIMRPEDRLKKKSA